MESKDWSTSIQHDQDAFFPTNSRETTRQSSEVLNFYGDKDIKDLILTERLPDLFNFEDIWISNFQPRKQRHCAAAPVATRGPCSRDWPPGKSSAAGWKLLGSTGLMIFYHSWQHLTTGDMWWDVMICDDMWWYLMIFGLGMLFFGELKFGEETRIYPISSTLLHNVSKHPCWVKGSQSCEWVDAAIMVPSPRHPKVSISSSHIFPHVLFAPLYTDARWNWLLAMPHKVRRMDSNGLPCCKLHRTKPRKRDSSSWLMTPGVVNKKEQESLHSGCFKLLRTCQNLPELHLHDPHCHFFTSKNLLSTVQNSWV